LLRQDFPDAALIAGSGVNQNNVETIAPVADAAIVGTGIKRDGVTTNPVNPSQAELLVKLWKRR